MARFDPVEDVIDSLCLRSGDVLRRKKGVYMDCANDVWNDLNQTTLRSAKRLDIKIPRRHLFHINKRTNSIDLPCSALRVSSVNVVDGCGIIYPVYRNLRLHDDIVDVSADKNCSCEFKCGNQLCNLIKGYEAITTTVTDTNPDGSPVTFTAVSRKVADRNGVVYEEFQYPEHVYTNGVWTSTILKTEQKILCECEVDHNGCICDTPNNIVNVCNSCGINNFDQNLVCSNLSINSQPCIGGNAMQPPANNCDEWVYFCDSKMDWFTIQCGCLPCGFRRGCENIYNISELGNRLIFPAHFGFDRVLVRFYEDIDLADLMIPYIARQTFMAGLQYFEADNDEKRQPAAAAFGQKYSRLKWGLFLDLNRMRIKELGQTIAPKMHIPSYIERRDGVGWWGWY